MENITSMTADQNSHNCSENSELTAADTYITLQDNIGYCSENAKIKTTTPSFILELPLHTTPVHESTILVRLDAGRQLYNACLGESLTRLDLLRQSKEYQHIIKLPKGKARTQSFKDLNKKFEFTQYSIHNYAAEIRQDWIRDHIGIHIAQKLAARAFKAVQKKAFGQAKNVRFKALAVERDSKYDF